MEKLVTNSIKEDGFSLNVIVQRGKNRKRPNIMQRNFNKHNAASLRRGTRAVTAPNLPRLLIYQLLARYFAHRSETLPQQASRL